MTRMGLVLLKVYPLYKDVLITGIILHDIGKLKELKTSPLGAADFTADGNLFGHVLLIGFSLHHPQKWNRILFLLH